MRFKIGVISLILLLTLSSTTLVFQEQLNIPITVDKQNESVTYKPADGTVETMVVNVIEDECVISDYPNDNFDSMLDYGGLWVGYYDIMTGMTRSWLKFDLSYLPRDIAILSASLKVYLDTEDVFLVDAAIGVYHSTDDAWTETTITWNNQPNFVCMPSSIIDSPVSPDMFVEDAWYSWDITDDVRNTLTGDGILTEVLKQVDEESTDASLTFFCEKDYSAFLGAYVAIEYTTPTTDDLSVDGASTPPLIDYIQDATPDLGWMMSDPDPSEHQKDYDLQVYANPYFNTTSIFTSSQSNYQIVSSEGPNHWDRPFGTMAEMRFQFKYPYIILPQSGRVDKLLFPVNSDVDSVEFENLIVTMACTSNGSALTSDFEANFNSATDIVVLKRDLYSANIVQGELIIDVEDTFIVNHAMNLIIEIRFTFCSDSSTLAGYDSAGGGSVAYKFGPGAFTATTASNVAAWTYDLTIDFATDSVFNSTSRPLTNAFPFGVDIGTGGVFQIKYNRSMIDSEGFIDMIHFGSISGPGSVVYENLRIYLVETPVEGPITTDFEMNYGGVAPTLVLDEQTWFVHNINDMILIDVNDIFYFQNEHDLLIEFRFDSLVSGAEAAIISYDAGGYSAYNLTYNSNPAIGQDARVYDMGIDFVYSNVQIEYAGQPLTNDTEYFWRVRSCDSVGIWSEWAEGAFTYRVVSTIPKWQDLIVSPDPISLGSPVTVSINVTCLWGVSQVLIEFYGMNITMAASGNIYSHTWTPPCIGTHNYTIHMSSNLNTWNSVGGSFEVQESSASTNTTGTPVNPTTLGIVGIGAIAVIGIIIIKKKRG